VRPTAHRVTRNQQLMRVQTMAKARSSFLRKVGERDIHDDAMAASMLPNGVMQVGDLVQIEQ
jgi:hypothetical protein